ncbi:sigma 54-interacting transcriptional regulator [Colwellia sp. Bg11-12]|uniref:sigma 54-interacting transcriptional regulator n=1 Tax=Colwellia sp. Bg11-12 TaxID=2759817 RepID=UPI0015F3AA8D|nr:sigma 54-interacting transcriptional regulator [Colwellia sp. Bg11-12]MBA6262701.1 sigma 54-interacting transcriptional regulator [Colwellia sp. Bg11-12]
MRIEIKVKDRIGISQEVLAIFAENRWNICSLEVVSHFIYVDFMSNNIALSEVQYSLSHRDDIVHCLSVDLLPTQRREAHLKTLLDTIPDPILDIDQNGIIVIINTAAQSLIKELDLKIEGQHIDQYIDQSFQEMLSSSLSNFSLAFLEHSYLADITPIFSEHSVSGVILTLRSMNRVGQHIALIQSKEQAEFDNIIGENAAICLLKSQTLRFSELELPVLISGETGTGKELLARALHNASRRADAPFLALNCAALPENLLESELFGYAPGAFTGAQKGGKPGLFELAETGTIFLDEIAEMSVYLQAKLLRFLQDYKYRRLGGTKELTANVRIISASHQNLPQQIERQLFREDLFYRLNVLSLSIPPLRDRPDDIILLASHFIEMAALQVARKVPTLTEQALVALKNCQWPGNIRQLQNILFRAVALNDTGIIEKSDIDGALSQFTVTDLPISQETELSVKEAKSLADPYKCSDWRSAQEAFEHNLLKALYPLYPTTRKLAERLNVSHNKIAIKLRKYDIN